MTTPKPSTKVPTNGDDPLNNANQLKGLSSPNGQTKVSPSAYSNPKERPPPAVIVLNVNARQVTSELVPICQKILGEDNVYLTTSNEEAQVAAKNIARRNPTIVIPVGGDGTLTGMMNHLSQAIADESASTAHPLSKQDAVARMPLVGYIPLGTGNGAGSVVGCQAPKPKKKGLARLRSHSKIDRLETTLSMLHKVGQTIQHYDALDKQEDLDTIHAALACDIVDLHMMQVSAMTMNENHELVVNDGAANGECSVTPGYRMECLDELAFFAGVGFDSLMLNDFKDIQTWTKRRKRTVPAFIRQTLSSVGGYCVALVTKTLPKCISRQAHEIQVRITTTSPDSTLWIDHRRGDVARSVSAQQLTASKEVDQPSTDHEIDGSPPPSSSSTTTVLYEGKSGIVAAGTAPYYGGGLRLFPFSCLHPNKLHLRIGRINPIRGFFNMPSLFAGTYRDMRDSAFGCIDFIGPQMDIQVSSAAAAAQQPSSTGDNNSQKSIANGEANILPSNGASQDESDTIAQDGYPLQHSGESVGIVENFRLQIVPHPIRFVTFKPKRVIYEDT